MFTSFHDKSLSETLMQSPLNIEAQMMHQRPITVLIGFIPNEPLWFAHRVIALKCCSDVLHSKIRFNNTKVTEVKEVINCIGSYKSVTDCEK